MKYRTCVVSSMLAIAASSLVTPLRAGPITVVVPGTADPWLAGMPAGSTDCINGTCDSAPDQSPVLVTGLVLVPGSQLAISATGGTSQDPTFPLVGPGGTSTPFGPTRHAAGAMNGIADISPVPFSALIGVFLDNNQPDGTAAPSPASDFTKPGLKQPFLIGSSAIVTVPVGATRLFLATMDSGQWSNNRGTLTVQIGVETCLLYDPTKAANSGSTIPIKLELCDINGNDLSSPAITLHAVGLTLLSTSAPGTVQDSGNANPDNDFRFDPGLGTTGGYIFNLSTKGFSTGTYSLNFTASSGPFLYSVPFQVK